ncbi:MAG: hypothetical protein V1897_03300 [Pseudomonadota bacterium]
MNLLEHVKITAGLQGSTHGIGATAGLASTFLDMQGWDGVLFTLIKVSSAINSSGTIIIQQSSAASTGAGIMQSTFNSGIGPHFTSGVTQNAYAIDVVRPLRRYVRIRTLTCTGVAQVAIQYKGRRLGSTEAKVNIQTQSGVHLCTT